MAAGSPFAPRAVLAGKDARSLARELLAMSQDEFSTAFKGSPMKCQSCGGLKRNAAVVLGNEENSDDIYDLLRSRQGEAMRYAQKLLSTYSPHNPESDNSCSTVHLLVEQLVRFSR